MANETHTAAVQRAAFETAVLSNGMRVLVRPMPGFSGIHAVCGTAFGSVDAAFELDGARIEVPAGTAHFLEHKMFESEEGDAFALYAATGASANAFTSFDKTCYLFTCTDRFEENLAILLGLVSKPYFTEQTIAKEQGNVIKLEHNQFVSINRSAAVELRITLEAFGTEHKKQIMKALEKNGYKPKLVRTNL